MFENVTPESQGLESKYIADYLSLLERRGMYMHGLLFARHGKIIGEYYWKPFNKDFCHRMYSETKSFVAIAIGLLVDEGKISLDDKIYPFFEDKIEGELPRFVEELTVRNLLMMKTAGQTLGAYDVGELDREKLYFKNKHHNRMPGTLWEYDSNGSQILSCIVERLTGESLLDYLKRKIFDKIGTFQTAQVLKTYGGRSWGDSAMVCTPRDILSFAQFLLQKGNWEGEQLLSESYVKDATSKLSDNHYSHFDYPFNKGYGYQIWKTERDGFAFLGMGDELTICIPEKDFIMVCTADHQGTGDIYRDVIVWELFDKIIDNLKEVEVEKNEEEIERLENISSSLKLRAVESDIVDSPFRAELDGVLYECEDNPMGIEKFSFHFSKDGKSGEFHYVNKQGDKVIPFGVNHNVFSKFPQLGYFNDVCFEPTTDGFMMDDAVSVAWYEEKLLMMSIKIIDRYMGNMSIKFSFRDEWCSMYLSKTAEYFLHDYCESQNIEHSSADARFIAKRK
ncbi:MAG: beta-lactamase family protein [Clostridia bacterium]|nr:beta-lactamase family protein [Clostridia bacterium]